MARTPNIHHDAIAKTTPPVTHFVCAGKSGRLICNAMAELSALLTRETCGTVSVEDGLRSTARLLVDRCFSGLRFRRILIVFW